MHRIIVIGRGLVGSAAGRHLSALTDGVAVLGPDEPADRAAQPACLPAITTRAASPA